MAAVIWIRQGGPAYWERQTDRFFQFQHSDLSLESIVLSYIQRWNQILPIKYGAFRATVCRIVQAFWKFPQITEESEILQLDPQIWVLPMDDDDWHNPILADYLDRLPDDCQFAWWDSSALRWCPDCRFELSWVVPDVPVKITGTCAYAVRAGALQTMEPEQRYKLRHFHVFAPILASQLNLRQHFIKDVSLSVWNVTPASASVAREYYGIEFQGFWPRPDVISRNLGKLPDWIRLPAEQLSAHLIIPCAQRLHA